MQSITLLEKTFLLLFFRCFDKTRLMSFFETSYYINCDLRYMFWTDIIVVICFRIHDENLIHFTDISTQASYFEYGKIKISTIRFYFHLKDDFDYRMIQSYAKIMWYNNLCWLRCRNILWQWIRVILPFGHLRLLL